MNHLLFGRTFQLSSIQSSPLSVNVDFVEYSNRVKTITNRFWNQWRNEYLLDLKEAHKLVQINTNLLFKL